MARTYKIRPRVPAGSFPTASPRHRLTRGSAAWHDCAVRMERVSRACLESLQRCETSPDDHDARRSARRACATLNTVWGAAGAALVAPRCDADGDTWARWARGVGRKARALLRCVGFASEEVAA